MKFNMFWLIGSILYNIHFPVLTDASILRESFCINSTRVRKDYSMISDNFLYQRQIFPPSVGKGHIQKQNQLEQTWALSPEGLKTIEYSQIDLQQVFLPLCKLIYASKY